MHTGTFSGHSPSLATTVWIALIAALSVGGSLAFARTVPLAAIAGFGAVVAFALLSLLKPRTELVAA